LPQSGAIVEGWATQVIEIATCTTCATTGKCFAAEAGGQTRKGCGKTPVWVKGTHGFAGSPASRSAKDKD
jgi:hypothetical protein